MAETVTTATRARGRGVEPTRACETQHHRRFSSRFLCTQGCLQSVHHGAPHAPSPIGVLTVRLHPTLAAPRWWLHAPARSNRRQPVRFFSKSRGSCARRGRLQSVPPNGAPVAPLPCWRLHHATYNPRPLEPPPPRIGGVLQVRALVEPVISTNGSMKAKQHHEQDGKSVGAKDRE